MLKLLTLLILTGCLVKKDPAPTYSQLLVERGDIVVVSYNNDSLVTFDSRGNVKKVIYQLPAAADSIGGIAWNEDTNEILIAVEGTPDRIEAYSVLTGVVRTFYNNISFFTGTITGITTLKNSPTVLVSESATIERFTTSGVRMTYGSVWPSAAHVNSQVLVGLSTGNFLSCSSTLGVRTYPDSTTALTPISQVTGPTGATASYGCAEMSNGSIIVSWSGASSDFIYSYSATLTGGTAIVNNIQSTLSDPRGVAVGEQDQIYVADGTLNKVVELDSNGNVVQQFGNSVLNGPRYILVIPAFTP